MSSPNLASGTGHSAPGNDSVQTAAATPASNASAVPLGSGSPVPISDGALSSANFSSVDAGKPPLLTAKHVAYIQHLDGLADNTLSHFMTQHLRLNGLYWALMSLAFVRQLDALSRADVIAWVLSCYSPEKGAFAPFPGHDVHVHATLSAVQILVVLGARDTLDTDAIVRFVLGLQTPEGAFTGDAYGEVSSRYTYCAVATLALLGRRDDIDVPRTVGFIRGCLNFDGGFGNVPGAESHAAFIWTSLGALAILDRLDTMTPHQVDTLAFFLCERQLPDGGLNGRPQKLEDVCYSWWVLASLAILGRVHWVDRDGLVNFILSAQDTEAGGIADRPEDVADMWHTVFGLAGLSLLKYEGLDEVDPIYCMPIWSTPKS